MKTASKKMELELVEKFFNDTTMATKPLAKRELQVLELIDQLDWHTMVEGKYAYFRVSEFVEGMYSVNKRLPTFIEFYYFAEDLRLGWKRYILGCSHQDSYFFKQHLKLKANIPCQCCLYWRGRLMQLAIDAALVTCGVLTYNFFS